MKRIRATAHTRLTTLANDADRLVSVPCACVYIDRRNRSLSESYRYAHLVYSLPSYILCACVFAVFSRRYSILFLALAVPGVFRLLTWFNLWLNLVHLNFCKKYFVWNKFRIGVTIRKYFQFIIIMKTFWIHVREHSGAIAAEGSASG